MATQYTSILKLALPVQGELSGTWGDTVNDNITSMVEEAIAGRAVINTWTTNSHTLSTANGTTSEARCAMLEFTDTGTALTGAGTVICPTATKIYIAKNDAGQAITLKTSGGTGIAVPDGETMFLFCDGTNVVEAITSVKTLKIADGVQVNTILDEDNMASDSATALATQQSIKAYVDAQVTAQDLDFAGDSGTGAVDLDSQSLTISGTANEIETSASGQTITIGLPTAVTVTTVTATNIQATNLKANDGTAAITIADSTGQTTINNAVLTTADINGGTADNVVIGGATAAAGSFTTVSATGNIDTSSSVVTNTIAEKTATTGVTVDGVLLKDGGATFTANTNYGDNDKAIFGDGSDLEIFHDGSDSYIKDAGTGHLQLWANDLRISNADGSKSYLYGNNGGSLVFNYDGSEKLRTTATGIDVTGTVTADGVSLGDSENINIGASNDLQIYHNGSDSYINESGTGTLIIATDGAGIYLQKGTSETIAQFKPDAECSLYYDNGKKFETTTNGVDITGRAEGTVTTDNDGGFNLNSSNYFICTPSASLDITFTNETTGVAGAILLVNTTPQTITVGPDVFLSDADLTAINSAGTYLLGFYCPDGTNVYMSATPALTEGS